MARIRAQSVAAEQPRTSLRELYATVCYYYPQYKLDEVQRMPARNIYLLIRTAMKIEAQKMYNLTAIAAAPHSEKQRNVKKLLTHFEKVAKG